MTRPAPPVCPCCAQAPACITAEARADLGWLREYAAAWRALCDTCLVYYARLTACPHTLAAETRERQPLPAYPYFHIGGWAAGATS